MADTLNNIGTRLYASASAPATEDAAGYAALTWTEVKGVGSIGAIGASHETLSFVDLADGITKKAHGTLNYGDPEVTYRNIDADAGQGILQTALDSKSTISFKVVRASGLIQYSQGIVMGNPYSEASASSVSMRSSNLALSNAIIEV